MEVIDKECYDAQDDILKDYFIIKYPFMGPVISILYLIMAKKVLPKYMENRPAYNIKTIMRIYNVIQVIANTHLVLEALKPGRLSTFWDIHCTNAAQETPFYLNLAYVGKFYVYLKILDLMDTVFIILKKKESQLSFLHLFHHSVVLAVGWTAYYDREKLAFPATIINCFVHGIMYTYYLLASMESQRWVIRFKRHVTQLQITQFLILLIFNAYIMIRGCPLGKNSIILWHFTLIVLLYQFVKFYYESYLNRKKKN